MLFYLFRETEACIMRAFDLRPPLLAADLFGRYPLVAGGRGIHPRLHSLPACSPSRPRTNIYMRPPMP